LIMTVSTQTVLIGTPAMKVPDKLMVLIALVTWITGQVQMVGQPAVCKTSLPMSIANQHFACH